jgi:ATP-dependent exoDNAse (exonuclease V) beta subunit
LRLLRELYVAVTRARRRVVVLINKNVDTMIAFFKYFQEIEKSDWSDAEVVMMEFNREVSIQQWFDEGTRYFEDEKYVLAAVSCFV